MSDLQPSIIEVIEHLGGDVPDAASEIDGWVKMSCPFHDDEHSSASINETEGVFKCHGCEVKGDAFGVVRKVHECDPEKAREIVAEMHVRQRPAQQNKPHVVRRAVKGRSLLLDALTRYEQYLEDASDYLKGRGITRAAAQSARLGVVRDALPGHEPYRGRLVIPYVTTSGVVNLKFRCMSSHSCKEHGHPKYLGLHGETRMYHVTSALTNMPYIAVTEGEIDALILNHLCGIPAVGIPGANNWKPHFARVLEGFDRIYVLGDGDKAGHDFARTVAGKVEGGVAIPLPEGQDVNDVFLQGGVPAVKNLMGV